MKRIRVVVADNDSQYLDMLDQYLQDVWEQESAVSSFSEAERLASFLSTLSSDGIDVLLLSEGMSRSIQETMGADAYQALKAVKIILSEQKEMKDGVCQDWPEADGFQIANKYQKMSALCGAVWQAYGKATGQTEKVFKGDHATKFIGVYSPVGGSGKTILSLMLAQALAYSQKQVFYLNCETIDSTSGILPVKEDSVSVSDLLESGENLGSLLSPQYAAPEAGFSYVKPLISSLEWNELREEERDDFFYRLQAISRFDYVVLDFDSDLSAEKTAMLKYCDQIVMPFLADAVSVNKMRRFFYELRRNRELNFLNKKIIYIGNRIGNNSRHCLTKEVNVTAMLPSFSEAADPSSILNGSPRCRQMLEPILKQIQRAQA